MNVVYLVRGLPGSGKSTIACDIAGIDVNDTGLRAVVSGDHRYLSSDDTDFVIVSYDFHCVDESDLTSYPFFRGIHTWDRDRMVEVNELALETFQHLVDMGCTRIIVDQPSLNHRDVKAYADAAHRAGYMVVNVEPQGPYDFNLLESRAQRQIDARGISASNRRWSPVRFHPDSLER